MLPCASYVCAASPFKSGLGRGHPLLAKASAWNCMFLCVKLPSRMEGRCDCVKVIAA